MKHIPNEIFDKAVFINEIYSIRNQNDVDKSFFVIDKINSFDVKLKQDVIKKFGSIKLLQEVPVQQTMIGGLLENDVSITADQKKCINDKIRIFFDDLKVKL